MTAFQRIQTKIYTISSLALQVKAWRQEQKKIVFTNGCFDIFHLGHLDYLSKASDLGDVLIIGINSDQSVTNLKGNDNYKKIPVFVVSNTASPDKVQSYMRLGVNKYYVKAEHRLDEIIEEIHKYLANPTE